MSGFESVRSGSVRSVLESSLKGQESNKEHEANAGGSLKAFILPLLRNDLRFIDDARGGMVYDPLQHRYLRVDSISMAVLKTLATHAGNQNFQPADLLREAGDLAQANIPAVNLEAILRSAERNSLLQTRMGDGWKASAAMAARQNQRGWRWLLHSYISFRLPLLRPEPLLAGLDPLLRLIFSRTFGVVVAGLAVAALYLLGRQWSEFSVAVKSLADASMLLGMGVTLLFVKLWHEIGHGHFARRYGCRVPSAGVLVILGAPLFYTDVTDAWQLPQRRERMMIAAAGIMAEVNLAVFALLVWVFVQDGPVRTIAFFIASGSLITTVLINLSPFMRFDGYFLLSDGLRIPNLHERGFEALKWYQRRIFFGLDDPLPPLLTGLRHGWLALFGAATVVYRLMLFLGIALFVYHAFFKIAGLILFAIEIAWFILRPLQSEMKVWMSRRKDMQWNGTAGRTACCLVLGTVLLFAPLSHTVSMKAVLEPASLARSHAPSPAQIEQVHVQQGQHVEKGDRLLSLVSPQLLHKQTVTQTRLHLVRARLARSTADPAERGQLQVLQEEERSLLTQLTSLATEIAALELRAPESGIVIELNREAHPGRTVAVRDRLVLIGSETGLTARGMARSEAIERLQASASAVFIAEDAQASRRHLTLERISAAPSALVEPSALAVVYGGDVPSAPDKSGKPVASVAAYHLVFRSDAAPPTLAVRGTIHVTAASESLGLRALKRAVSVIVRESGA